MLSRSLLTIHRTTLLQTRNITQQRTKPLFSKSVSNYSTKNYKTLKEFWQNRPKDEAIPITWRSLAIMFGISGVGLWYLHNEKQRIDDIKREKDAKLKNVSYGKPNIGGDFTLTDHTGKIFNSKDHRGKFLILYFGFTHCPDICPDELEKMSSALRKLSALNLSSKIIPLFITVDPKRDTPSQLTSYLKDFPDFIGLTGTEEEISKVAKLYRIYVSKGEGDDYLVDHSIFFFFIDSNGEFRDYFGRNCSDDDIVSGVRKYMLEA